MSVDDVADAECLHGCGPVSACTICNGREARKAAADAKVVYWFPARYDGRLSCGCRVDSGDPIGRCADGSFVCGDHGL